MTAFRYTDLLLIARDMQQAGAGIRSLAEPFHDTTSDFAEIIFAIFGVAKLELFSREFPSSVEEIASENWPGVIRFS